jgi:hypothetical protein
MVPVPVHPAPTVHCLPKPALFARVDGLCPPAGPVCISRTALYSKMWRRFDRGLHAFLVTNVYKPFVAPTYSWQRKLFGLVMAYTFVLLWHGVQSSTGVTEMQCALLAKSTSSKRSVFEH